jgi:hypothetical protein
LPNKCEVTLSSPSFTFIFLCVYQNRYINYKSSFTFTFTFTWCGQLSTSASYYLAGEDSDSPTRTSVALLELAVWGR